MDFGGHHSFLSDLKKVKVPEVNYEEKDTMSSEPLSPMARMFHEPESNVYVITILGFKSPTDPLSFKLNLEATLLKHPRFSCVQVADEKNGGELKWVPTEVNIDKHLVVCNVDEDMISNSPDQFFEDYVANLSKTKLSMSIPMWDCHILNLKTSDADSTVVLRAHHSHGDGTSLMSLLLACARKVSYPDSLPTFPAMRKKSSMSTGTLWIALLMRVWSVLLLTWNTVVDMAICVATTYFLNDTPTPLKPSSATTSILANTPRRIIRRTFSLDDVKFVKNATNTTVNDVMVAVIQAGLSRYLNRKYGKESENNLPKNIRLRATLFAIAEMGKKNRKFAEWGNKIGYVLFPFKIALEDDLLDYIRKAKATMDRKKATLEASFRLFMAKIFVNFYPTKVATFPATTMWLSNVAGPQDEISLFGNQVTFVAPSLYGQPVPLTIHIVSYGSEMNLVLSVDEDIIPDPYQLCDDIEASLKLIKESVIAEGPLSSL